MAAGNKRFGEIGGEVFVRISVCPLTVSDNPNCVQLIPNFAKPPGRWLQCGGSAAERSIIKREKNGKRTRNSQ
jgi:hypothetical protein